jgi:hypothetical protein
MLLLIDTDKSSKEDSKHRKPKTYHPHHALVLHTEKNFEGTKLYTDSPELRLPIPIAFKSHSHVGLKNWTVFSEVDLSGRMICLVSHKSAPPLPRDGSKPIVHQKLVVGSIKRGCDTDPVPEVITPPPEASDRQTDASSADKFNVYFKLYLCISLVSLNFILNK